MSNKPFLTAYKSYKEFGYVIKPIPRLTQDDVVTYPAENIIELPEGSQLSGAKSQNDWSKFGTPDDIIRIYALVPVNRISQVPSDITKKHMIYVFPTGQTIALPRNAEKLTIVKESNGDYIWHIYDGGIIE